MENNALQDPSACDDEFRCWPMRAVGEATKILEIASSLHGAFQDAHDAVRLSGLYTCFCCVCVRASMEGQYNKRANGKSDLLSCILCRFEFTVNTVIENERSSLARARPGLLPAAVSGPSRPAI